MTDDVDAATNHSQRRSEVTRRLEQRRDQANRLRRGTRFEAPLTDAQAELWLHWHVDPNRSPRIARVFSMDGQIERPRLERAIREVLEETDALRCIYPEVGGAPVQQVRPVSEVSVTWHGSDRGGNLDEHHVLATLASELTRRTSLRVDLTSVISTEVVFTRVNDVRILVALISHSIAIDGWSEPRFATALRTAILRDRNGESDNTSVVTPRFIDAAAWSASATTLDTTETWRTLLNGAQLLDPWSLLPRGQICNVAVTELDAGTVDSLTALAATRGTTLFAGLTAAAVMATGDLWNTNRPLLQIPTGSRHHPDMESLVGRFAESYFFAGDLRAMPSVGDVIERVGRDLLTMLDATRAPRHRMLAALPSADRHRVRPSVHIQLRGFAVGELPAGAPWLAASDLRTDGDAPLQIVAEPRPDGSMRIVTRITPPPGADDAVATLAQRVVTAVRQLARFANRPWTDLAAELHEPSIAALTDPSAPLERQWDATVLDRIIGRVAAKPDAIAVESVDGDLTYTELLARAQDVAHQLHCAGSSAGDAVIITGVPSAGVAIAMLGALLAGTMMVPLSADLPQAAFIERSRAVDARFSIAVGTPPEFLHPTVRLETSGAMAPEMPRRWALADMPSLPLADDPAYVFFTSGSSRSARSVVGLHGSLCQFIDWQCQRFSIGVDDRVAMLTSIGFDVVLRNVFLPWAAGARLVIPPANLDPDGVVAWIAQSNVTVVHVTPALASAWTTPSMQPPHGGALRWAFFSGDRLLGTMVRRWRASLPHPGHVVNLYGPTETCMARAAYCIPDVVDDGVQPVGWPMPGSQLHVVDEHGQLLGPGEQGEIVVRTVHGTAGYGNEPEAWAQRATLGPAVGEIRYRTGDLGVSRDDGAVTVLGRLDDEVKVNDTRTNPADIAAHLMRLAIVAEAAVISVTETDGRTGLLAGVVLAQSGHTASDVRAALAQLVPASGVPRQIVLVDRLALTPNGKLDRAALTANSSAPITGTQPAADDIETQVIRIWQTVFPNVEVHADTNFFDIGGHSITALRMIHRISTELSVLLSLNSVFTADSPAAIAGLVRGALGVAPAPARDAPTPERGIASVSSEQQRLAISQRQQPFINERATGAISAQTVIASIRVLLGPLDMAVLQSAINALVERHWALRTWFDLASGEQVIASQAFLPVEVVQHGPAPLEENALHTMLLNCAAADLGHWPLITPAVVHLGTDKHVFAFVVRQPVADDRSIDILIDELRTVYEALVAGSAPELPAMIARPMDIARVEQEHLDEGVIERDLAFWRAELTPPLLSLDLPTDHPRKASIRIDIRHERVRFRPAVRALIETAATESNSSTFRVLGALWAAFLSRLDENQQELTLVTHSTVREARGADSAVGMFVSDLPLRIRLRPNATVSQAIDEVTMVVARASQHHHPTFAQIADVLELCEDHSNKRPFEFGVNLLGLHERGEGDTDALRWRWFPEPIACTPTTLELRCYTSDREQLTTTLRYDAELFDRSRVRLMIAGFAHFIEEGLADLSAPVASLPLVTTWPSSPRAHRLLAQHATVTPNRPALVDGDRVVNYAELDGRVDALANALLAAGVQPATLVAVAMGRGVDLIATLLAVHRVGAGSVALHLDAPRARLELILADTLPHAIVADSTPIFATHGVPVIRTDEPGTTFAATDPIIELPDETIAYVVYTSGSTGRPKGVAISHRALEAYTAAAIARHNIEPGDRMLQTHNAAFDVSAHEIYATIAAGATLVIGHVADVFGGATALFALVERQKITRLVLPTSVWQGLVRDLEATPQRVPSSVVQIVVGGQVVDPDVVRRWHRLVRPGIRLTNSYGPAEFTVFATASELDLDNLRDGAPTPIGTPLQGVSTLVIDDNDGPVAVGERGELLLAGPQIALGYLGRPDLTAERFVEIDGVRWYRTGDIVRQRTDGELEFHGRIDNQVKIRGFRIEPGEIEAALLNLPRVREAVVVATTIAGGGDPILVAHLLISSGANPDHHEIRDALAPVLPTYMLPSDVVVHDELPRTPGGKPDRPLLAATYQSSRPEPRTQRDKSIAASSASFMRPQRLRLTRAPLSFAQRRFWLLRQIDNSDSYQVRLSFVLNGRLDLAALGMALSALVARHEILRTRYHTFDDGLPYQLIDPAAPLTMTQRDLRGQPTHAAALAEADLRRPFDLVEEWPIRAALFREGDAVHRLMLVIHHIAVDAESAPILLRDLAAAYNAAVAGHEVLLPALEVQYSDQAVWELAQAAGGNSRIEADIAFWVSHLDGVSGSAQPARHGDHGDHGETADHAGAPSDVTAVRSVLSADLVNALRRTAAALRVTPSALVFAALGISIGRVLGADDFVLGLPVTTRSFDHDAELIGPMINTVPFMFRTRPDDDLRATATRIFAEITEALEHRLAPFDEIVRATQTHRDGLTSPLVSVVANVFDDPEAAESVEFAGLEPVIFDRDDLAAPVVAKFDLTVVARLGRDLTIVMECRSVLERDAVRGWMSVVTSVLEGVASGTYATVGDVASVGTDANVWLRDQLNDTARPFPDDRTVDSLVADATTADPTRVAVIDGETRHTYAELAELAAEIQADLIDCGVAAGDRVMLVLDRSFNLIASMLACLRIGAAYVPVEPSQPAQRTATMLADSGASATVRHDNTNPGGLLIEPAGSRREADAPLLRKPHGTEVAAVMYTSGSTGAPKGVLVPHRAIVRLVQGADYLQLTRDDVVAFASNPAFDASTWEVWGALTNGSTLVVLAPDVVTSPHRLGRALRTHHVSAMFVTTALFNVVASVQPDEFKSVETVLFGGEACDPAAVRRIAAARTSGRLLHVYGPTESTTFALWHRVDHVDDNAATVPIGLPIANTTAHVLDTGGRLVPVGVVGELYLGGVGLALGYLGDPGLTGQRFVADHLHPAPGARLYRTGDLVRRRPTDGAIEFVGRVDRQVKVRGFRIQLEEVEAAFGTHPAVTAAVVDVDHGPDGVTLAAFIEATDVDERELRRYLEAQVSSHMIPSTIVVVPRLQLTANGKLDRSALDGLRRPAVVASAATTAPISGPMLDIWTRFVGGDANSADESFFDLGGYSLLAVRMLAAIRHELGVDLPLSTIFEHQTLRELSALVEGQRRTMGNHTHPGLFVSMRPGTEPALYLVHSGNGHVFDYERLAAHLPAGRAVVGVIAKGLDGHEAWDQSIEEMAATYVESIIARSAGAPVVVGGFSSGGIVAFEMARQLVARGHPVEGLILFDPTPGARTPQRWQATLATARAEGKLQMHGIVGSLFNALRNRWNRISGRVARRMRYRMIRRFGWKMPAELAIDQCLTHHLAILPEYRLEAIPSSVRSLLVIAADHHPDEQERVSYIQQWERLVGAETQTSVVSGAHGGSESLLAETNVTEVAVVVSRFLDALP